MENKISHSLISILEKSKSERKGYILLPSINGFEMIEISVEKLNLYLQMESLYQKSLRPTAFICPDCHKPGKEYKDGLCEMCHKWHVG